MAAAVAITAAQGKPMSPGRIFLEVFAGIVFPGMSRSML